MPLLSLDLNHLHQASLDSGAKRFKELIRLLILLHSSSLFSVLDFRKPKTTSFNDSQNKKKLTGSHPGLTGWTGSQVDPPGPGSTGFSRANSRAGFCLHPDRSQARVGRVPGRPAGPGFKTLDVGNFLASPYHL